MRWNLQNMEQDKTDRRSGADRRSYQNTIHIPERRSGKDRRIVEIVKEVNQEKFND
jgi:hypothetical protein